MPMNSVNHGVNRGRPNLNDPVQVVGLIEGELDDLLRGLEEIEQRHTDEARRVRALRQAALSIANFAIKAVQNDGRVTDH